MDVMPIGHGTTAKFENRSLIVRGYKHTDTAGRTTLHTASLASKIGNRLSIVAK